MANVKAIQSIYNQKYVQYYVNEDHPHRKGHLQASETDPTEPYVKVTFQPPPHPPAVVKVNIKSVYPQKYWVPHQVGDTSWLVVAGADEPNEVESSSKCTLFEIQKFDDTTVRIYHRHLVRYVCVDEDDFLALLPSEQTDAEKYLFNLIHDELK